MNKWMIIIILLLSGCAGNVTTDTNVDLDLPTPTTQPMMMEQVEFHVADGAICLTPDNYENLSRNMQEALRFIKEQKLVIEFMKD